MKEYTAPEMEILEENTVVVFHDIVKNYRIIGEELVKINPSKEELEEYDKENLKIKESNEGFFFTKITEEIKNEVIDQINNEINETVDNTIKAISLNFEANLHDRDKQTKAKNRRLDAKFKKTKLKAKNFKKARRLAADPETSKVWLNRDFAENSVEQEIDDYAREEEKRLFGVFDIKIKLMGYGVII